MSRRPLSDRSELLLAIENWHAGTMNEVDALRFKERLRSDISACQAFIEYGDMLTFLSLEVSHMNDNAVDVRIAETLSNSHYRVLKGRVSTTATLLIACLLIIGGITVTLLPLSTNVPVADRTLESVAVSKEKESVAIVLNAVDSTGATFSESSSDRGSRRPVLVGKSFSAEETLTLDKSIHLVELRFASSARLVIQGPAVLHLDSANSATLDSGRVLGVVPPAAVGFLLKVPNGEVCDLGTEFAVDAGDDTTDVAVLVGSVDCKLQVTGQETANRQIFADEQVRLNSVLASMISLASPPESLQQIVEYHDGIASITGEAQYVRMPAPLITEAVGYPSSMAQIYLEAQAAEARWDSQLNQLQLRPAESLNVPFITIRPDICATSMEPLMHEEVRVDSYLIRVRSPSKTPLVVNATIRFRQDVVAVLASTGNLTATDECLARPEFVKDWREHPNRSRGSAESADVVRLGEDRRTLTVTLQASGASDELRVLVRSPSSLPDSSTTDVQ